jgi:hypothetical protein
LRQTGALIKTTLINNIWPLDEINWIWIK